MQSIKILVTDKQHERIARIHFLMQQIDETYQTFEQADEEFDLYNYCKKLNDNAEILIASVDNQDVGLAAIYLNENSKIAYITFFGILRMFQGTATGASKKLFTATEDLAIQYNMRKLMGEIHKDNKASIYFFKRNKCMPTETQLENSLFIYYEKYLETRLTQYVKNGNSV